MSMCRIAARPTLLLALGSATLVAACSSPADPAQPPAVPGASATTAATPAPPASTARCPELPTPEPPEGPSADAVVAQQAGPEALQVDVVRYPRPDYEGEPWSHWGQGLALPDGRLLTAIGDHRGEDGNSFLLVYDPPPHGSSRASPTSGRRSAPTATGASARCTGRSWPVSAARPS